MTKGIKSIAKSFHVANPVKIIFTCELQPLFCINGYAKRKTKNGPMATLSKVF
jgi:hypothetical protein